PTRRSSDLLLITIKAKTHGSALKACLAAAKTITLPMSILASAAKSRQKKKRCATMRIRLSSRELHAQRGHTQSGHTQSDHALQSCQAQVFEKLLKKPR